MVSLKIIIKRVLEMYWVHSIDSYIREESIEKWVMTTIKNLQKTTGQIYRYIYEKTYLLKVRLSLFFYYNYLFHWTISSYTNSFIYCVLLLVLISLLFTGLQCFLDKVQVFQGIVFRATWPIHQKKAPITFGECGVSLMDLTSRIGKICRGGKYIIWINEFNMISHQP